MNNNLPQYIPKVFISYKREDEAHNAWVEKLASNLMSNGVETSLDVWSVRLGESFTEYMTSMIGKADIVLFIMTKNSVAVVESVNQGAVKFEMQLAMSRKLAGEQLRVIGIYKDGGKVSSYLRDHRYADFRDNSKYNANLKLLIDDLLDRRDIPKVENLPNLRTLSERHIEVLRTLTSLFGTNLFSKSDMDRNIDTHERFTKVFNDLLRKEFISSTLKKGKRLYYNVPSRTIKSLQKAESSQSPDG
jgi:hypothetical protein